VGESVKVEGPADVTRLEFGGNLKVLKRLMVGQDGEWVFASLEPRAPMTDRLNDGEKFTIVRPISLFGGGHLSSEVSNWVLPIRVLLNENSSNCKA